ncbi:tape measure protein [Paraclostridium bifermentans]|uniref:tape measure protein n=1 Tax=Paraclostridium bifermentans TaxID=1490 RepID=UPI00359CB1C4
MATIRNAITMQDRVTPVFNKMNRAMEATLKVMRKVNASSRAGVGAREFTRAEKAIRKADNALIKYQNDMRKANQETSSLGNATNKLRSGGGMGFMNAYAAVGLVQQGAQLVSSATNYLDTMSLMQARVSMINDGMQTTNQLQDKILASANRARSSYKDTTAAVTKLNMLAGDQFKTNDEAIGFVETLNKMFAISGTSGQEASAAMYQLTQAMGAGKLQGDEFKSIMENAPMLADAIAKSMGKSKGELKELSSEGAITADIIKKAMTDASKDVNKQFATIPMTFGQKMTILKNNFMNTMEPVAARFSQWLNSSGGTVFFDSISNALVTMASIGVYALEIISSGIMWLKQNFEFIEPVIIGLGIAFLWLKAQSIIAAFQIAKAWALANLPFVTIIATIMAIVYVLNLLGIDVVGVISTIIGYISNVISFLWNMLSSMTPLIYAIGAAIVTFWLLPYLITAFQMLATLPLIMANIWGVIVSLWAMIPPLIAQFVAWLALNWPILLVAIAVGILIFVLIQLGVTAADVIGFVVGLFFMLMAVIYNVVILPIYNQFSMLANFLSNLFIDPIGAIQMLFLDMATYIVDKVRWVAQSLQDLVNMIPGVEVNIVGNLDNIKAAIDSAKADVSAKRGVKKSSVKSYKSLGKSYNSGFSVGHKFASSFGGGSKGSILGSLANKFKMPSMPKGFGMDKGKGMFKPSGMPSMPSGLGDKGKGKGSGGSGKMPKGLSDKLNGGNLDKIGKIEDDVAITDEDIKLLKDVAKTEFINKYTTLRPNMKVEFTGPVTETADINKIISAIEDMTEEALSNTIVEGA